MSTDEADTPDTPGTPDTADNSAEQPVKKETVRITLRAPQPEASKPDPGPNQELPKDGDPISLPGRGFGLWGSTGNENAKDVRATTLATPPPIPEDYQPAEKKPGRLRQALSGERPLLDGISETWVAKPFSLARTAAIGAVDVATNITAFFLRPVIGGLTWLGNKGPEKPLIETHPGLMKGTAIGAVGLVAGIGVGKTLDSGDTLAGVKDRQAIHASGFAKEGDIKGLGNSTYSVNMILKHTADGVEAIPFSDYLRDAGRLIDTGEKGKALAMFADPGNFTPAQADEAADYLGKKLEATKEREAQQGNGK